MCCCLCAFFHTDSSICLSASFCWVKTLILSFKHCSSPTLEALTAVCLNQINPDAFRVTLSSWVTEKAVRLCKKLNKKDDHEKLINISCSNSIVTNYLTLISIQFSFEGTSIRSVLLNSQGRHPATAFCMFSNIYRMFVSQCSYFITGADLLMSRFNQGC